MKLNKNILIKYQEIKNCIEDRAEEVLKGYFIFKDWNFPTDFSLENVEILNNKVEIVYYGFQNINGECVSIDYFLTLDNKFLIIE